SVPGMADFATHAYVVIFDGMDKHTLEAGPEFNPPRISYTEITVPSLFGPITFKIPTPVEYGKLFKGNPLYPDVNSERDQEWLDFKGIDACDEAVKIRNAYLQYKNDAQYRLFGPNSNSFINYLLKAAGL